MSEDSSAPCADCAPSGVEVEASKAAGSSEEKGVPESTERSSAAAGDSSDISFPQPAHPAVTIEFCDRCRWAPRATWTQTELLLTFPTPLIRSITLIPLTSPETGGRFRVWLDTGNGAELMWDRKSEGGFPELKVLKQRIRNRVSPEMGLGHSDKGAHGSAS